MRIKPGSILKVRFEDVNHCVQIINAKTTCIAAKLSDSIHRLNETAMELL
jgi:hypothetical protein